MLCAEIVRSRPTKIIESCRFISFKSLYSFMMPEAGEKREAGLKVDGGDGEPAKKPKLEETSSVASEGQGDRKNLENKLRLRKFAMCISYCGKGYLGLQINHGFKTVEGDLMEACHKAGLITEDHVLRPQGMSFQRAARTDKGVSAIKQVLSLKLPTHNHTPEQIVEKINEHLVEQIRVIGLKRVTKNFNSKNNADARTYLYVCPTFAFTPSDQAINESSRLPAEKVDEINRLLAFYKGCHNFHNFTSGKPYNDPSAKRVIFEIDCSRPFLVGELEYVQFRIKGQSFMLHQIRKMVGVIIGIMRGYTTDAFITRAFGPEKLDLPKAPPLGLMLDTVHYTRYDTRYGGDGSHEAITWEEHQDVLQNFKTKYILPNIWDTEEKEESMGTWLVADLDRCAFDIRRAHEDVPKTVEDAPDDEVHSDDESDLESEEQHCAERAL